jgi:hypothetical protein
MSKLLRDHWGRTGPKRADLIAPELFGKGADFGAYGILALKNVEDPWRWGILANIHKHFYLGGTIKVAAEWLREYQPAGSLTCFERRCVLSYCARWARVRLAAETMKKSAANQLPPKPAADPRQVTVKFEIDWSDFQKQVQGLFPSLMSKLAGTHNRPQPVPDRDKISISHLVRGIDPAAPGLGKTAVFITDDVDDNKIILLGSARSWPVTLKLDQPVESGKGKNDGNK